MKGFIIEPTYRTFNGIPYVCLFGKLENGESFVTLNKMKAYFYIKKSDLKKAKKVNKFKTEKNKFKNFKGKEVVKILVDHPQDVSQLTKEFEENKIKCYEADLKFPYRFLLDNKLKSTIEIEGDFERNEELDRVYKEPKIKPSQFLPKLKLLSIDIETNTKGSEIYCIGLYSEDYKKVIINSNKKLKNAISCNSEEEVLERFYDELKKIDPDIITGWNFIDFDLHIIKKRFKKYEIPFTLGRDYSQSRIKRNKDFFKASTAKISGRMVLDGIDLLKSSFIKLKSYKLDNVAKIYLNDQKLIQFQNKGKKITELFKKNPQKLVNYNLKDAELVYKILEKTNVLNLAIHKSLLTGMPLDKTNSSIASLEQLYIMKAIDKKLVCPSKDYKPKEERIQGAFVKEPKPGIYDYILIIDFKSLYPSIIKTFNIDPASHVKKPQKNVIKAPNNTYFKKEEGILPSIIQELWNEREKAKKAKNELANFAIKTLMNSFFGVLANPHCRFYSLDIANAITYFGQHLIKLTAEQVQKQGYDVIYADTDSNFIISKTNSIEKANKIGKNIEKTINNFYKKHIKEKYGCDSYLEIEYEKCYIKFLIPRIRGKTTGAKKRYAGLLRKKKKEKIEIVGLEFVRSDWTELTKKFQYKLLDLLFHNKDLKKYINQFIKDLFKGKYDELLIYKKSIRKPLSEYTKTTPPHVKAARKQKKLESNVIQYIITTAGPEPISNQKHSIDYEHYLDKQIKPIANSILIFFETDLEEIKKGSKQTTLGTF